MTAFVDIPWRDRRVRIEHRWIAPALPRERPLIVFLHEGLGSVSMWRDFPDRLCEAAGARGLVYSRPGYGRSTPRAAEEAWGLDFMHRQAHEVLPALLQALDVDVTREPPVLFGHSDGGSIALLHAARWPDAVRGLVVLAPHILVEDLSITSIAQAREAYRQTDLRQRLSRHHEARIPRSTAGTTSGCIRLSANGRSRRRSAASPAPCSPSRAWTTSTGHSSRSAASPAGFRRPGFWKSPTAATRPIGINPKP